MVGENVTGYMLDISYTCADLAVHTGFYSNVATCLPSNWFEFGPRVCKSFYESVILVESMMGLMPRHGNLRIVFRLFTNSLMRGLPRIRLK